MTSAELPTPPGAHVLVVAAGRGSRAGGGVPKQFRPVGGEPLIARTMRAMLLSPQIGVVTPVIHPDDEGLFAHSVASLDEAMMSRIGRPAHGGATRQDSVHAGLEVLAERGARTSDLVLIHDGARPFASRGLVERAVEHAARHGAAVPGCPVTDTVKQTDGRGAVAGTVDRARLRTVQTPQAFRFDLILAAHRRAAAEHRTDLTDDAAVAEFAGHEVFVFEGEPENTKITTPSDFGQAERTLFAKLADVRTGQGYDVHAFVEGDHVWLGGLQLPHDKALSGHSDADVVLHAVTDAILGAIGDGDIGAHFPPSQAQWKGAASDIFLRDAVARVARRGGVIAHIDATVVCERPKIGPHREAMRERIAAIIAAFQAKGWRLATAESCTGGLVAGLLTEVAGSSAVVDCGFVTYSNEAKAALLGVDPAVIERHGAVSAETAAAMAQGALARSRADCAVSITGIAGPGGGSAAKPVGLVHFGLARRDADPVTRECRFPPGTRAAIRLAALREALGLFERAAGGTA